MVFGDAPAGALAEGLNSLIERLAADLGRIPTVEEVDALKSSAPEVLAAIEEARKVFRCDMGRDPSAEEIAAGLAFVDAAREARRRAHLTQASARRARPVLAGPTLLRSVRWARVRAASARSNSVGSGIKNEPTT
jgi:hypothetical protein